MKKKICFLLLTFGSYIYAILPRMKQRAEKIKGNYYAHRGLHSRVRGIPENSMAAFRRAVEAGYGIELDIQLSKDGEVVVFHDFDLKRVCGAEGAVSDFTYDELQKFRLCGTAERIPRFEDVLKLVDGQVPLLVEYKYKNLGSKVCERADRLLKKYQGEYVIESFQPLVLLWYRIHRPEICRGQLAMNYMHQECTYTLPHYFSRHLLYNFIGRPDFIAYDRRDEKAVSKNILRKCFGCPSAAWTVKSKKQLKNSEIYNDAFIFEGFDPKQKK